MKEQMKKRSVYQLVLWAVFAALVFVGSQISVPIPVAVGDVSRIHLGNIFCLLAGFILGPLGGGLAAGVGSALYDMTNPVYLASAPFTFVFKFLLAAVCGWVSWAGGRKGGDHRWNTLAAVCGSLVYLVLYLAKSFAEGLLIVRELGTVLTALATKAAASGVNAVIAVAVSVPLCAAIRMALKRSGLLDRL